MHIYSVYDPAFKPYGRAVEGLEGTKAELAATLLAHPDSAEAKAGAYIGLAGRNIDLTED